MASNGLPAIWVNGQRQALSSGHVSAQDRGFTLADGLFETMSVRHGAIFRLDRHLERLVHGLVALDIPVRSELRDWVLEAARVAGDGDASVRVTVSRGSGSGGVAPPADVPPTVVVAVSPLPFFSPEVYDVGLAAHVASGRRNEHAMTAGLKTLAYTDAVAALLEARRAGADEALFLDTEAHCSEATSSNLFMWTGKNLVTPPFSCGALPGITRAAVLELAGALGVPGDERAFGLEELLHAEEIFLTSSLRQIAPVVRVGAHPIGRGTPGALTRQLTEDYRVLFHRESRL